MHAQERFDLGMVGSMYCGYAYTREFTARCLGIPFQDKLIHFFLFFVLTYLAVGLGIKEKRSLRGNTRFWINFALFALLPSVVLETAQHLIPYRSFDLKDLLFNALGVFSGLFGYLYRPTCKFILD